MSATPSPSAAPASSRSPAAHDHVVVLHGATWADYQRLLEIRGEAPRPRLHYLEGAIEIMSTGRPHEELKGVIGRLVDAWCFENDVDFTTVGNWTLLDETLERGAEPDESYIFGPPREGRPDLAIEVVWTHGGLDKLEIYRLLGVREVWIWQDGVITPWVLQGERFVAATDSEVLPGIDIPMLATFVDQRPTSAAVRAYRIALASGE